MGNTLQYLAERVTLCASADTWIEDEAIRQLQLAATLPGMRRVAGMPDLHPGRGYPVGAAFFSTGCLYPALIGGDIGCGMALWQTTLDARRASAVRLVGRLGSIDARLDDSWQASIADAGLAGHAFAASLGTIGSGNHFAELQKLDTVYDADAVQALGLDRGRLQLLVHAARAASASRSSSGTWPRTATTPSTTRAPSAWTTCSVTTRRCGTRSPIAT